MKKKERITINGETFTVEGTTDTFYSVSWGNDERDIFEAYGRPSQTKIAIWRDWCKWAREVGASLVIASHNCFRFTIRGNVEYNGKMYNLYITDCYNRAYEVI